MPEILDVSTEPVIPAQTTAPDTEPTGWMPLTDEQRSSAPESVKKLLEAKKWGTVEDALKGYSELEKFTGVGKHLVIPESKDDAEGWNNVYNQLGRPETPDGYVLEPNEMISDELASKWKAYAHGEGYTQKQAAGAVQFQLDIVSSINEAENAEREKTKAALKQKWGGEEAYKNKTIEARQIADSLKIYQTLERKGLNSDPDIIEMLLDIASRTAEGVITPSTPPTPVKTPTEERDEIMKNPEWKDKFSRNHKKLHARYMELSQIIANSGQGSQPNSR